MKSTKSKKLAKIDDLYDALVKKTTTGADAAKEKTSKKKVKKVLPEDFKDFCVDMPCTPWSLNRSTKVGPILDALETLIEDSTSVHVSVFDACDTKLFTMEGTGKDSLRLAKMLRNFPMLMCICDYLASEQASWIYKKCDGELDTLAKICKILVAEMKK